jgi:hypothetical protein
MNVVYCEEDVCKFSLECGMWDWSEGLLTLLTRMHAHTRNYGKYATILPIFCIRCKSHVIRH